MATQENTSTINTIEARDLLESIQNKIEMIQAIATAAMAADPQRVQSGARLFDAIDTICTDAAEYGALKRMLQ
jgi:hypothetical protein